MIFTPNLTGFLCLTSIAPVVFFRTLRLTFYNQLSRPAAVPRRESARDRHRPTRPSRGHSPDTSPQHPDVWGPENDTHASHGDPDGLTTLQSPTQPHGRSKDGRRCWAALGPELLPLHRWPRGPGPRKHLLLLPLRGFSLTPRGATSAVT